MPRPFRHLLGSCAALLLSACATVVDTPCVCLPPVTTTPATTSAVTTPPLQPSVKPLQPAQWEDLPDWQEDRLEGVREALLISCRALGGRLAWSDACTEATRVPDGDFLALRTYFESYFTPYRVVNPDGSVEGLVTGYYEPVIRGGRERSAEYGYPIYGVPADLIVVDLAALHPDLKHMRLRGRIEGRRLVPYYSRAELEIRTSLLEGEVIGWAADPVELFFMQIQGSGLLELTDGARIRLSYADQNGHPYRSIGRYLVEQGALTLDQASMQGIQAWVRANPQQLVSLLNTNPSYVFFRERPADGNGPDGALGVPLTAGRSIAVDPRVIPLGAPVYLATVQPLSDEPLRRLVMAQDTGGAIRGAVRADYFWGAGPQAGAQAGRMRSRGQMWVLLPKDYSLDE